MSQPEFDASQLPTLFLSHGGPNVVTDESPARRFYETLAADLPTPKAVVIMSAHFETDGVAVVTDPTPEMIYDFGGGFASELFEMVYPAPGEPDLAERIFSMLSDKALSPSRMPHRGYDHGAWTMMRLLYPDADIPIVQVSIDPSRDAAWHHRIGEALAPLRDEGVLLIGSGHITHNLRAVFTEMSSGKPVPQSFTARVDAFTDWFEEAIEKGGTRLLAWKQEAPFVADNHPTDEHLMPIFFAHGAAGPQATGRRIHHSRVGGALTFDVYRFD
ncbi:class III extradiol ring-cleavage dioxygenase [Notoacmeibacter sp. MSK16QG-6]|uniref:DODA-type extradiol aromatic ring-opening family dioxygenase n=1 Tax=Notoacmeibacter sp. MSK16QG-6 TaxID=2957982 RepID=UPI00209C8063|nr:class III extradiol ring-cleavage dioxygenase [Notoacmeibacter sp. MSK16QG-6]MCP1199469.1 dioxygenase [Notoacmeibacter sp. MSK16QG-6]